MIPFIYEIFKSELIEAEGRMEVARGLRVGEKGRC